MRFLGELILTSPSNSQDHQGIAVSDFRFSSPRQVDILHGLGSFTLNFLLTTSKVTLERDGCCLCRKNFWSSHKKKRKNFWSSREQSKSNFSTNMQLGTVYFPGKKIRHFPAKKKGKTRHYVLAKKN